MSNVPSMYLYLIRRNLTRYGIDELVPVEWSMGRPLKARNLMLVHKRPFDQRKRDLGADRPVDGETRSATKTL